MFFNTCRGSQMRNGYTTSKIKLLVGALVWDAFWVFFGDRHQSSRQATPHQLHRITKTIETAKNEVLEPVEVLVVGASAPYPALFRSRIALRCGQTLISIGVGPEHSLLGLRMLCD